MNAPLPASLSADLHLPLARYRFDCVATSTVRLPDYAGSTLRGAFGNALRRTACMTRQKDCKGCPLYRSCPYPELFETPAPPEHDLQRFSQIPNPYVIEPPPIGAQQLEAGERISFHMVLVGRARAQLPLVIHAWQRALRHGIGAGDGTLELVAVSHIGQQSETLLWQPNATALCSHADEPPAILSIGQQATLTFTTPLRLQDNGKPLGPNQLTARTLLVALARRLSLLTEFHAGQPALNVPLLAQQAESIQLRQQLRWHDWARYSSRQQQLMKLGGLIGSLTLSGNLQPFASLLHHGQWAHLGKNATFGLGHYQLQSS